MGSASCTTSTPGAPWQRVSVGSAVWVTQLSVQYVPRQETLEFSVRKGQRVNGIRSDGLTSTRLNP